MNMRIDVYLTTREVLRVIVSEPGRHNYVSIAEDIGCSRRTVATHIDNLKRLGYITVERGYQHAVYQPTEDGKKALLSVRANAS
jgi:DNA-binding MarR family transcriptional regulator